MIAILLRVSDKQLEEFLNESSLLEEFANDEALEESGARYDLDKSWDAINYLVTGHSFDTIEQAEPPLSQIIFSGQIVDAEQDMGYGPAHYLRPDQVQEIYSALQKISGNDLVSRYDAAILNEKGVYPQAWSNDEEEKSYITENFDGLKAFYAKAAMHNQAMITYVT